MRPAAKKLGLTTAEAALRWLCHHGGLRARGARGGNDDAVITGASSAAQLSANLASLEKGPLPEEMVWAFDKGWAMVKGSCSPYYR